PWTSTAPFGQTATHAPHPLQATGFTYARGTTTPSSSSTSWSPTAPGYGHVATHSPEPRHRDRSTRATNGSISTWSPASSVATLAAAAEADVVLSAMSIGPRAVSTGRSFGCTSSRNPSAPVGALVIATRSSTGPGSIAVARTTRSTGTSSSAPNVRVSRVRTSSGYGSSRGAGSTVARSSVGTRTNTTPASPARRYSCS